MASFDFNRRSFGTEPASLGVSAWGGRRLMDGTGSTSGVIAIAASSSATGSAAPPVPLAPPDRQPSDLKLPEPAPRKAGWAIVGLGQLALEEVIPAFRACRLSQPVALVSGHSEKAHTVADAYGIEHTNIYDYESYDRLADNPAVDVVSGVQAPAGFSVRPRAVKGVNTKPGTSRWAERRQPCVLRSSCCRASVNAFTPALETL